MDHHLEICLLADPELAAHQVMGALYSKLHRSLVTLGTDDIGVSFPDYDAKMPTLGSRLRLHGDLNVLTRLTRIDWLTGVRDHVSASAVLPVPAGATHRAVRRVQSKSNPARLRRRLMRRHGLDEQEAEQRIPDTATEWLRLPFVQLPSASTGQTFRLFIAHAPIQQTAVAGEFNAYGLSRTATVPWF